MVVRAIKIGKQKLVLLHSILMVCTYMVLSDEVFTSVIVYDINI